MSFFSSIPTWGWFDIGFNVAVLVALGGETDVILRRVFPDRVGELLPPETKRKKLKKFCEWLLIMGIAGEICCLPFSLYGTAVAENEAGQANERAGIAEKDAEEIRSTNLGLQTQLLELKSKMQDRQISGNEFGNLIECLREAPKETVFVGSDMNSGATSETESRAYALQIVAVLDNAGINVLKTKRISLQGIPTPGVWIMVKDKAHPSPCALAIQACFRQNRIFPSEIRGYTFKDDEIEPNIIIIWISTKP